MRSLHVTALLLVMSCAARGAESFMDDLRADYAAGQYRPCLQKISRYLSSPTAKAGSVERYDLFMLRGDCLLQLKQGNLASDAFDSAARTLKATHDLKRIAPARANSALIKASPGLAYKSEHTGGEAIDILQEASRTRAMTALLSDRLDAIKPQIDSALQATTLTPLKDLLPAISDAYMIELTATGDSKDTLSIAKSLGEHARALIEAQLQKMDGRIDDLYNLAIEPTLNTTGPDSIGYRGLTSPEREELQQMATELKNIKTFSLRGRAINRVLGGTGEAWDKILFNCDDCEDRAERAYARKY
jgi:hypothetical protein